MTDRILLQYDNLEAHSQRYMDPSTQNSLAHHFRSLHVPGKPVVLANVYDAATAKIVLSNPHAKAVATASYAIAATYGVGDDDMTLEQNLAGISKVAAVVGAAGVSVSGGPQGGYVPSGRA